MNKEYRPRDIKYGLIVVDPLQKGEYLDILHFVGYWDKPTKQDADLLRKELQEDVEFELTEIAHRLDILPCPGNLLGEFLNDIIGNYGDSTDEKE
jgi:hypothetical protein